MGVLKRMVERTVERTVVPGHHSTYSLLQIGILKDKQRTLASTLQTNILQIHSRHLHNLPSGTRTPRKRNLINIQMARKGRTRNSTLPINHIDHTRWESRFGNQLRKDQYTQRRLLSRLQHNGVPARERRAQFPRRHAERIVPGDNLRTYAQRLTDRVCELSGPGIDGLAVQFIRPAGIIAQCQTYFC